MKIVLELQQTNVSRTERDDSSLAGSHGTWARPDSGANLNCDLEAPTTAHHHNHSLDGEKLILGICNLYWLKYFISLSDSVESYDPVLVTVQSVDPPIICLLMCPADWPHLGTWDTFITFLQTMSRMNLHRDSKIKKYRGSSSNLFVLCVFIQIWREDSMCVVNIVCIIQRLEFGPRHHVWML